jgi:hypothetical protein
MDSDIEKLTTDEGAPTRITPRQLVAKFLSILNFERGVFFTLRGLLLKPTKTVNDYLYGNRRRHANPLRLLFFSSAIAAFLALNFGQTSSGVVNHTETPSMSSENSVVFSEAELEARKAEVNARFLAKLQEFMDKYLNFIFLLSVPLFALLCALFFRKKGFNLAEHVVINAFLASMINVITIVLVPITSLWPEVSLGLLGLSAIYSFYFYMTTYKSTTLWGFVKSLLVMILALLVGMVVFGAVIFFLITSNPAEFGLESL